MANSAQARKRARQAVKQRAQNMSLRSTLRTAIKKVRKAIGAGDKTAAQAVYKESQGVIDSIADKKVVHRTPLRVTRAACRPPSSRSDRVVGLSRRNGPPCAARFAWYRWRQAASLGSSINCQAD